jgi:hypothetical protein
MLMLYIYFCEYRYAKGHHDLFVWLVSDFFL